MAFSAATTTGGKWQEGQPDSRTSVPCPARALGDKGRGWGSGGSRAPHSNSHLAVAPDSQTPRPSASSSRNPCGGRAGRAHRGQRSAPSPAHGPAGLRCSPRRHGTGGSRPFATRLLAEASPWEKQTQTQQGGQEDRTPSSPWQRAQCPGRASAARANATRIMFTFLCQNSFLGCVSGKNTAV